MVKRIKREAAPTRTNKPELVLEPVADPTETPDGLIIHINPQWRLVYDGNQFMVQNGRVRENGKHAGEKVWISKAYITDLDAAIVWLGRHRIWTTPMVVDGSALQHLCDTLDKIKAECFRARDQALAKIKPHLPLNTAVAAAT